MLHLTLPENEFDFWVRFFHLVSADTVATEGATQSDRSEVRARTAKRKGFIVMALQ